MRVRFPFQTHVLSALADTLTPVSVYLRLRDIYPRSFLLESTEDGPHGKSMTYLCCAPIATYRVQDERITMLFPDGTREERAVEQRSDVLTSLQTFLDAFSCTSIPSDDPQAPALNNGLFGYVAFDCIRYFDELEVQPDPDEGRAIPDMMYQIFRYVIAIDHYRDRLYIQGNGWPEQPIEEGELERLLYLLNHKDFPVYPFSLAEEERSNFTNDEYMALVDRCKTHIQRGDVFQIVPSRRFSQGFQGDEFNVYRALRSINPSPYLFYFDFGSFRILGSSPEAQLVVREGKASLFPIAGTYRRTGDLDADRAAVERLREDPKENAEHVMLVDLARNDLSKHCHHVHVEVYKEVQWYSHVIHLTSKVTGSLKQGATAIGLLADTFPMGTLSGAPKYRALELLDQYEKGRRRAYGGAIGCLGFDGTCNHAIVIRSFLSKDSVLHCQAGGGVVADSRPADEMQEVNNKLGALRAALKMAEKRG
ncbi:MAG: chorismate-binding protein [Myxococcales bacterium]|nr:chorismate-binding protein [Myxococcales bacterium]MCB9644277.1 chorismate-binding protein [Myxococcales bacterium]